MVILFVTVILVDDKNGHIHLCRRKDRPWIEKLFLSYLNKRPISEIGNGNQASSKMGLEHS